MSTYGIDCIHTIIIPEKRVTPKLFLLESHPLFMGFFHSPLQGLLQNDYVLQQASFYVRRRVEFVCCGNNLDPDWAAKLTPEYTPDSCKANH